MAWVAGVDGCRAGWVVALRELATGERRGCVVATFGDILDLEEGPEVVAIDIPIGLLDVPEAGGRACDREARRALGPARSQSVFSPPIRPALAATTFAEALAIGRRAAAGEPGIGGISLQCFHLFPKLREVDARMTPALQARVREVHPELAFRELRGEPLPHGKKTGPGRALRRELLRKAGMIGPGDDWPIGVRACPGVAADDLADAVVACWSAGRIAAGRGVVLPAKPPRDSRGLLMEIWR